MPPSLRCLAVSISLHGVGLFPLVFGTPVAGISFVSVLLLLLARYADL